MKRVQENKKKFDELRLGKYACNESVKESKTKDKGRKESKNGEEDCEYVPVENESETHTNDSPQVLSNHLCFFSFYYVKNSQHNCVCRFTMLENVSALFYKFTL